MGSLELHGLRRLDGARVLSVEGEIDETTVGAFVRGLEACRAGSRALVVDLTMCTVSSDGLAALIGFHRRSPGQLAVALVVRDPYLLRMLDMVGLSGKLPTYPTVNAALTSAADRQEHEYTTNFGRKSRPGQRSLMTTTPPAPRPAA
jgi:anti-sigma B factor antagonist